MAHAALCREIVGHFLNRTAAATQDCDFKAAVMVEMHMSRGDAQVVLVVLGIPTKV